MTQGAPRRVTRGYAVTLVIAACMVAVALLVASWGALTLFSGRDPVTSRVGFWVAPLIVVLALAALGAGLWQQTLVLLRGRRRPLWSLLVTLGGGAYLLWCLLGMALGMSISDTWLSPFAAVLPIIWALVTLLFWAVLARRVYTDRPTPSWPWEKQSGGDRP